jgi:hypothetical protein
MNVNITLVTTRTWPGVGLRRVGRGAAAVGDGAAADGFEGGSTAAISSQFRGGSSRSVLIKWMITTELQHGRQEGEARSGNVARTRSRRPRHRL